MSETWMGLIIGGSALSIAMRMVIGRYRRERTRARTQWFTPVRAVFLREPAGARVALLHVQATVDRDIGAGHEAGIVRAQVKHERHQTRAPMRPASPWASRLNPPCRREAKKPRIE